MIWQKIKNLFGTKNNSASSTEDTFVDVVVSLNKNYEISINLLLDDNIKNKSLSELEYSLVCAEFLNIIMSGNVKSQVLDIIINQIRNENNQNFIDNILGFLLLMDKKKTEKNSNDSAIIKPSQVFSQYKNVNQ